MQVYPPVGDEPNLTPLQRKLRGKLETDAYPFNFAIPAGSPASVTLQGLCLRGWAHASRAARAAAQLVWPQARRPATSSTRVAA